MKLKQGGKNTGNTHKGRKTGTKTTTATTATKSKGAGVKQGEDFWLLTRPASWVLQAKGKKQQKMKQKQSQGSG